VHIPNVIKEILALMLRPAIRTLILWDPEKPAIEQF
jgi:hypothetical protein